MSFSIQRETSDGTLSTIDLTIEYIDQADITVYVDDTLIESTGGVTPYTWEWLTPTSLKITPDVPVGLVAMVRRGTPNAEMYHDFNAGAVFKDETVDENFLQLLHLVQEAKEGSGATDFYDDLDMHGYVIRNHGAAIQDSDVVTFGQYRNDSLGSGFNRVAAEAARDAAVAAKDTAVASASAASTSEGNAAASEAASAVSASNADASSVTAVAAANTAVAALDEFDDRYLGAKANDPTLDNDGGALVDGALYWNTTVNELRVYSAGIWYAVALLPTNYLGILNNLSDLDDLPTAKINLGIQNVDNTSDVAKPISTAQAAGLVGKTSSTGAAVIPAGTEAQRPASPVNGQLRYNSEKSQFEGYQGGDWKPIGGGDSSPMFSVMWWPQRSAIPAGYVAADGQTLSRATYPDAWAGIQAGNVPTVAEATWQSTATERGKFTTGGGSTTFRLPDYNGKFSGSLGAVFLRGDGARSAETAGVIQRDAFQGHWHQYNYRNGSRGIQNLTGFIDLINNDEIDSFKENRVVDAISDGVNGTPRTASETRPLNVTGCWVIKLFGAVVNVGSADAAQLASDYANLAAALSTLDSQIDFTIIYPNGGSAASPANVAANSRYIESNPFPGHYVVCRLEVLEGGTWKIPAVEAAGAASIGAEANQLAGGDIIVQTCPAANAMRLASYSGAPHGRTSGAVNWPLPARVMVWKSKGVV